MTKIDSPVEIARKALLLLVSEKKMPTPDNFRNVYHEIAGLPPVANELDIAKILQRVIHDVSKNNSQRIAIAQTIHTTIEKQDWQKLEQQLRKLMVQKEDSDGSTNWSVLIRNMLKQLETSHKGITLSRKKEGLHRVLAGFSLDSKLLAEKIQSLIKSWGEESSAIEVQSTPDDPMETGDLDHVNEIAHLNTLVPSTTVEETREETLRLSKTSNLWRDMMLETMDLALIPSLEELPEAHDKAQTLLEQMQISQNSNMSGKHAEELKNLLLTLEMQRDVHRRINNSLLSLLRLLTQSMDELVIEDDWLHSQISIINDIVNKPINVNTLYDAEASLKDLIHKQVQIKPALHDARDTLKMMVSTFVNGLAVMTESTSDYHTKIESYQQKLSDTEEIGELNTVLNNILEDTKQMGHSIQKSRVEFEESQKKAFEAEQKIKKLTAELDHIHEVAHEDYLTGTLNRRGMDEALTQEFSRADRYNTTLCIAMMDIDHFKKLNDQYGHSKGDEALMHFAKIIKKVKRSTDVLARYGGEEFIIILPATKQDDAINVVTRVQRELTKNFFMTNNERLLITFSAGVAERAPGESPDEIIPRADAALYQAKNTGRNRVIGA